jgi:hypothetical protein
MVSLKDYDKFASPPESFTDASACSGVISLSTYVAAIAYLVYYVLAALNSTFPTSATTVVFPQKTDSSIVNLPPMTCVAESGCWYRPWNIVADEPSSPPEEGGGPSCFFLPQGEKIPEQHRRVVHDSDPIDSFTSLWKDVNFGWSYDVESVVKIGMSLKTDVVAGVTSLEEETRGSSPRYLLYKGKSLFNLVRTVGLGGDDDVVDT